MNIDTFIFDLGGVIIDLDESKTIDSFSHKTGLSSELILSKVETSKIFVQYEKGLISDQEFRKAVSRLFDCDLTDEQIDESWNAMLGQIPIERLELLDQLRKSKKVLILSNTNNIHIREFNNILSKVSGKNSLSHFADHVFFSQNLNMRKPEVEIYLEILKLSATKPEDALFLDDKIENLKGAEKIGINTFLVTNPNEIFKLRKYV